nr:hypothetical protein [Luteimicrobium album]
MSSSVEFTATTAAGREVAIRTSSGRSRSVMRVSPPAAASGSDAAIAS